jgi:hypothetical protein
VTPIRLTNVKVGVLVLVIALTGCASGHRGALVASLVTSTTTSTLVSQPSPSTSVYVPSASGCTAADLDAPPMRTMPDPTIVGQSLVLQPRPDLQELSPPDSQASITAAQAWTTLMINGDEPLATGAVQLLLGDLYAYTPASIQNYVWPPTSSNPDTDIKPDYTHTLVWALYSQDQPARPGGGGGGGGGPPLSGTTVATVGGPPCFFYTAISIVDATTGKLLFSEGLPR